MAGSHQEFKDTLIDKGSLEIIKKDPLVNEKAEREKKEREKDEANAFPNISDFLNRDAKAGQDKLWKEMKEKLFPVIDLAVKPPGGKTLTRS